MALAFLTFRQAAADGWQFVADLGENQWFSFVVGSEKTTRQGLDWVEAARYESPLTVAVPTGNPFQTAFLLTIPAERFDRQNRFVQLFSYRTADKKGMAISEIVAVPNERAAA